MNTHDKIELPAEFRSGNDIPVTIATIKRERMEEILSAAVEAEPTRVKVAIKDLKAWREEWLAENDPNDGTDCVTPFDHYLYGAYK